MSQQYSLSQRFYLFQQKQKEDSTRFVIPTNSEMYMFVIVLMELRILKKILVTGKNKISLQDSIPTNIKYLDSMIEFIKKHNNLNIYDLLYRYLYNQFDTARMEVGQSLENSQNLDKLNRIVDSLRAEILEPGEVSDTNKALILLLDTSNYDVKLSKKFFSDYEQPILKEKLIEIKKTTNELTNDLIFISSLLQSSVKDIFNSILPQINPMNFRYFTTKSFNSTDLDWVMNANPKSPFGILGLIFNLGFVALSIPFYFELLPVLLTNSSSIILGLVVMTIISLDSALILSSGLIQLIFKIKSGSDSYSRLKSAIISLYLLFAVSLVILFIGV